MPTAHTRSSPSAPPQRRRPRSLAHDLVDALGARIRAGELPAGTRLPTEAAFVEEFGVSRTVVREALSRLQAAGLVETRHGIGTFVAARQDDSGFRIDREQLSTLRDVIAMLELRIGVEVEAAGLAAQRRTPENLQRMRAALDAFAAALAAGHDAVHADFEFHLEIMRATQNPHFAELLQTLGASIIPRARLDAVTVLDEERRGYLLKVHAEHESVLDAIDNQDSEAARAALRTHLANSRERRRRSASPEAPSPAPRARGRALRRGA